MLRRARNGSRSLTDWGTSWLGTCCLLDELQAQRDVGDRQRLRQAGHEVHRHLRDVADARVQRAVLACAHTWNVPVNYEFRLSRMWSASWTAPHVSD